MSSTRWGGRRQGTRGVVRGCLLCGKWSYPDQHVCDPYVVAAHARAESKKLLARAAKVLAEIDDKLCDGSMEQEGVLEYLSDNVRPLVCDLLGHRPRCRNTDQCRERKCAT